jgi:hypothetical protein
MKLQIEKLHARTGHQAVREYLVESYTSRAQARPNSWQSALYEALSTSDWYCNGGFN